MALGGLHVVVGVSDDVVVGEIGGPLAPLASWPRPYQTGSPVGGTMTAWCT